MRRDLGKLKKTTSSKCPSCKTPLQVRQIGEKDFLCCPNCDFELKMEVKRKRRKEGDDL